MRFSICLFAAIFMFTFQLHAQEMPIHAPPRSISTTGESTVYVVPDRVIVNFSIKTFENDMDKSKSANDEQSTRLLKAIKSLGIEERFIQTDIIRLNVEYEISRDIPRGYSAYRFYAITVKDVALLEKLIDTALKNGANQLEGLQFETSELRKHRDAARKIAIKAAREKAVAMAGELEMKIGKPRTISEGSNSYYGYYSGSAYWGGYAYANKSQNAVQQAAPGRAEGGDNVPLGQLAVKASVSVTFDLE